MLTDVKNTTACVLQQVSCAQYSGWSKEAVIELISMLLTVALVVDKMMKRRRHRDRKRNQGKPNKEERQTDIHTNPRTAHSVFAAEASATRAAIPPWSRPSGSGTERDVGSGDTNYEDLELGGIVHTTTMIIPSDGGSSTPPPETPGRELPTTAWQWSPQSPSRESHSQCPPKSPSSREPERESAKSIRTASSVRSPTGSREPHGHDSTPAKNCRVPLADLGARPLFEGRQAHGPSMQPRPTVVNSSWKSGSGGRRPHTQKSSDVGRAAAVRKGDRISPSFDVWRDENQGCRTRSW